MQSSNPYTLSAERRLETGRRLRLPHVERGYAIFLLTALSFGLTLFERMSLSAIGKDLMAQFHLNAGQLGSLGSAYFYMYAVMQVPVGLMVDRFGPRRLLTVSLAIASAGSLIFAVAPNFAWLMIGRVLIGLGGSAIFIPSFALITAWLEPRYLAIWNGLYFAISYSAILLVGRPLIGLTARVGYGGAFLLAAGVAGLMAISMAVIVRDRPAPRPEPDGSTVRAIQTSRPTNVMRIVRSPIPWVMGMGMFLIMGAHGSFQAIWAGPFLSDVYDLAPSMVGNLLMLIPLGQVIGNLTIGWIADRLVKSRSRASMAGGAVYFALWLPMVFLTDRMGGASLAGVYAGFGLLWGAFPLIYPILQSKLPREGASLAVGIVNLLSMIGTALFQQVFGIVLNGFAPVAGAYPVQAYRLAFAMSLVSTLLGVLMWRIAMGLKPLPAAEPSAQLAPARP